MIMYGHFHPFLDQEHTSQYTSILFCTILHVLCRSGKLPYRRMVGRYFQNSLLREGTYLKIANL